MTLRMCAIKLIHLPQSVCKINQNENKITKKKNDFLSWVLSKSQHNCTEIKMEPPKNKEEQ